MLHYLTFVTLKPESFRHFILRHLAKEIHNEHIKKYTTYRLVWFWLAGNILQKLLNPDIRCI